MKLFAKLKHWQIFLIWIVLVIVFSLTTRSRLFHLTFMIYIISLIGWIFLVGKFYNRINKKNKVENYKENFWFVLWIVSAVLYSFEMYAFFNNTTFNTIISFISKFGSFFGCIMTLNFTAKAYSQYEKQKKLKFWDYFWNLVLILYMIIGVWVIQPKINREIGTIKKL